MQLTKKLKHPNPIEQKAAQTGQAPISFHEANKPKLIQKSTTAAKPIETPVAEKPDTTFTLLTVPMSSRAF